MWLNEQVPTCTLLTTVQSVMRRGTERRGGEKAEAASRRQIEDRLSPDTNNVIGTAIFKKCQYVRRPYGRVLVKEFRTEVGNG